MSFFFANSFRSISEKYTENSCALWTKKNKFLPTNFNFLTNLMGSSLILKEAAISLDYKTNEENEKEENCTSLHELIPSA